MKLELLNRISNLTFCGYYDESKKMITVHFFNEAASKPDIIAYLRPDMYWDVREILSEQSVLSLSEEIITIKHKPLGIEEPGKEFDKLVRLGLKEMAQKVHGEETDLLEIDPMFRVFEDNKY